MAKRCVARVIKSAFSPTAMLIGSLMAGAGFVAPVAAADTPNTDLLARGKYLTDAGDCAACHSDKGQPQFSGGRYLDTPFGALSTPNITPDKTTGIGDWTDDQFYRVMHEGVGHNGEYLYPAMPYPWYTKVTRDDVLAIKAYLFSLPPTNAPRKPNKIGFPFNVRTGLAVWDEMFLHAGEFTPDASKSAEVNRGAYLVEGLGHCGECHNGDVLLGASRSAHRLQGSQLQNWYAPNITSDVHEGVGRYSDEQVFTYLKTGLSPGMGVAAGPMAETIHDSLSKLADADLHAIVAYLKSTSPEARYTTSHDQAFSGHDPVGRQTYLSNCASCHQLDGKGIEGSVGSLVGTGAVLAGGPEDVIRMVLGGIEAKGSFAPMPAIGEGMTDQQVADVANYIRQAWGNAAPANAGPGKVGELRKSTFTALNVGPTGQCPAIGQPQIAAAVADPKTGINAALQAMTPATVLQTVDQILPKVKAAAPAAQSADVVNSLTIAYCPIIEQDSKIPAEERVTQLDEFSERVYSELHSNGKD